MNWTERTGRGEKERDRGGRERGYGQHIGRLLHMQRWNAGQIPVQGPWAPSQRSRPDDACETRIPASACVTRDCNCTY